MTFVPGFLRRGPWRRLSDRDLLHSLAIAGLACIATGGLLYVGYLVHAIRTAVRAPTATGRARVLLLFGKRLVNGCADADYRARIERAHEQAMAGRCDRILLLGGASGSVRSEAAAAREHIQWLGLPAGVELILEDASIDTLENLRNARALLGAGPAAPVALVSSRYHLARCGLLARQLGYDYEFCAAEARFEPSVARLRRLALEAGYILWTDVGTRWARMIGNRRMLDRVT